MRCRTSTTRTSCTTDFPPSSVTSLGAFHCGIDKVDVKGITSRGVLLDLVKLRGAETYCADVEQPITPAELDESRQGAGRHRHAAATSSLDPHRLVGKVSRRPATAPNPVPGLDWTCASWLHDHEVAAVAADNLMVENPVVRGGRHDPADAHAVPARHGPDVRRVLEPRPRWPRTAPPTAATNSSSSPRR